MNDIEILEFEYGGIKLRDMTTPTFVGWLAGKINNLETRSPMLNELTMTITNPPMGKLSDETKIQMVRKLFNLGVIL